MAERAMTLCPDPLPEPCDECTSEWRSCSHTFDPFDYEHDWQPVGVTRLGVDAHITETCSRCRTGAILFNNERRHR